MMREGLIGGLITAGVLVCSNAAISVFYGGINEVYPVAVAAIVCGSFLDQLFRENKYRRLFHACGLMVKEGKTELLPIVLKKTKTDTSTILVLHLPEGLSQKQFEQKKTELEQALNCKIEFGFNKNLILKLIDANLRNQYKYTFLQSQKPLEVYCGESHEGKFILDLEKCPHAIVAGETNSGKSSLLRNIILSLILNFYNIDLHLIDFQAVELGIFEDCKKVLSYGETPADFEKLLDDMAEENDRRLKLFRSVKNKCFIQNLSSWNDRYPDKALPHKVVVIDEFSRLSEKEYEELLEKFRTRVSMDRKVGIHYVISMQRPDIKCISGSIKANMPTRLAYRTVTGVDSEVILDQEGAEKIKDQGRCLVKYCGEVKEMQTLYIEPEQVRTVLRKNNKFKTRCEIQAVKKAEMKKLRDRCINPYLKKVVE